MALIPGLLGALGNQTIATREEALSLFQRQQAAQQAQAPSDLWNVTNASYVQNQNPYMIGGRTAEVLWGNASTVGTFGTSVVATNYGGSATTLPSVEYYGSAGWNKPEPESALGWLNRRVDEVRVRL